jgi:hypothetical protein
VSKIIDINVILYKGEGDSIEIIDDVLFQLESGNRDMTNLVNYMGSLGYDINQAKMSQWHQIPTKTGHIFYMNLTHDHKTSNETMINRMSKLKDISDEV